MNKVEDVKYYSLKGYLEFLNYENVIVPFYQRPYVWGKKEVKELFNALGEGYIGDISLIEKIEKNPIIPNVYFYNIIDGQQRTTTLILLLKVLLHKKIKCNTELLENPTKNINYFIADKNEFTDFKNVDKYLNGENVKFNNKHYKEAIDTLLKLTENVNGDIFFDTTLTIKMFHYSADENFLYNRKAYDNVAG